MQEESTGAGGKGRVFVSYSRSDRVRVNGLGLLLQALGHSVFVDHKTILPGRVWKAELQKGLQGADVMVVFWTRFSARSEWVRREYEYFHAHHPDRPLIPIVGDETQLTELLKTRQSSDFAPLINELLEMQRSMTRAGEDAEKIREAILERLREAGIELDEKQQRKLFLMFGTTWFLGFLGATLFRVRRLGTSLMEAGAQFSLPQLALVGISGLLGVTLCQLHERGLGPFGGPGGESSSPEISLVGEGVESAPGNSEALTGLPEEQTVVLDETGAGEVKVSLLWQNGADLDLHVTDPNGETIYYEHPDSQSGGSLDRDDHRECANPERSWGVENIHWPQAAPAGEYEIVVVYFMECSGSETTDWRVQLDVKGAKQSFVGAVQPEENKVVARFRVSREEDAAAVP